MEGGGVYLDLCGGGGVRCDEEGIGAVVVETEEEDGEEKKNE